MIEKKQKYAIQDNLVRAVLAEDIEKIKQIINSLEMTNIISLENIYKTCLENAIIYNKLNVFYYLMEAGVDVVYKHDNQNNILKAVTNGNLEIAKSIIEEYQKLNHPELQAILIDSLELVCYKEYTEIVDYLLTDKNLNIYQKDLKNEIERIFTYAIEYNADHMKIIKYFVIDFNITKTVLIAEKMKASPEIENLFNLRDLNEKLRKETEPKVINESKNKI